MNRQHLAFLVVAAFLQFGYANPPDKKPVDEQVTSWIQNSNLLFEENKGQFKDDNESPVPFVLFKSSSCRSDLYVTTSGLSYVFHESKSDEKGEESEKKNEPVWCSRLDVMLAGAEINIENILTEFPDAGVKNYYIGNTRTLNVHSFRKITVKDVYPKIDWVIYFSEKKELKYDFVVHAGGNPSQINIRYGGAKKILIESDNSIKIITPLGEITESGLYVFEKETQQEIQSKFILKNNDVRIEIGNYNPAHDLIIDPQLTWGTYYGGTDHDGFWGIAVDDSGNVIVTGEVVSTNFPLMNPGGGAYYQASIVGWEGLVVKFNNSGVRYWSTYLGGGTSGLGEEDGVDVATDSNGNIFVVGYTLSSTFPVLNPGGGAYFQSALGGQADLYIVKFTPTGVMTWSTYYGGIGGDGYSGNPGYTTGICVDINGNVLITSQTYGNTLSSFPLYNPGGGAYFQPTSASWNTAFFLKFNNNGVRLWATAYSGNSGDGSGFDVTTDASGNIYGVGTTSSTALPTMNPGGGAYFQAANAGGYDAYIVKFDSSCTMKWATYFGGSADDNEHVGSVFYVNATINTDAAGNIFVAGRTRSQNLPVVNPGGGAYFQGMTGGGTSDLYILKFNSNDSLVWATYYGGSGEETACGGVVDVFGNFAFTGYTHSPNFPTFNPGCFYDSTYNGGGDVFILAFNNSGVRTWATYYGGSGFDWGENMATDANGSLFVAGELAGGSTNVIMADPGGGAYYQPTKASASEDDGFILKFTSCSTTIPVAAFAAPHLICPGNCTDFSNFSLNASSFQWYFTGASPSTSSDVNPVSICYNTPGSYDVTLIAIGAGGSDTLLLTNYITVYPTPPPQSITQNGDTLSAIAGAGTYQWFHNGNIIPGATNYFYIATQSGDYNVVATNTNGCEVEAAIFNVIASVQSTYIDFPIVEPNPFSNYLSFHFHSTQNSTSLLKIFNSMGEVVLEEEITLEDQTFNLEALVQGIYLVRVLSEGKAYNKKIVK